MIINRINVLIPVNRLNNFTRLKVLLILTDNGTTLAQSNRSVVDGRICPPGGPLGRTTCPSITPRGGNLLVYWYYVLM
jgi:hypothetical protein